MELVYARSSKQPGGLLKHRDKRLLLAIIVSGIAGAGLGEIFWPRVKPSFEEAVEPRKEHKPRGRPSRRCGLFRRGLLHGHTEGAKQRQESLLAPP